MPAERGLSHRFGCFVEERTSAEQILNEDGSANLQILMGSKLGSDWMS